MNETGSSVIASLSDYIKGQFVKTTDTYEYIPSQDNFDQNVKEEQLERASQAQTKNIDYTPVDPSKSYQFFEVGLNGSGHSGYRQSLVSRQELSEGRTLPSNTFDKETPFQRYQRLQFEIEQFSNDMELLSSKESDSFVAKEMKELNVTNSAQKMKDKLDTLGRSEVLSVFLQPTSSIQAAVNFSAQKKLTDHLLTKVAQYEKAVVDSKELKEEVESRTTSDANSKVNQEALRGRTEKSEKLVTLEKRLNTLESIIGVHPSSGKEIMNVESTLSAIERKVSMLDDGTIKSLTQRIRNLNHELDTLANKKRNMDPDVTNSLDDMMDKIRSWNNIASQVPLISSRLQALKTAHEDSILFGETIRRLTAHQQEISDILTSNGSVLQNLSATFGNNMKIIESNVDHMDSRMQSLQEKLTQVLLQSK